MVSLLRKAAVVPGLYQYGGCVQVCPRAASVSFACAFQPAPVYVHSSVCNSKRRVPVVLCRAEQGRHLSVTDLLSVLGKAAKAWDKYDKDRNGAVSLKECETVFNSKELCDAFEMVTNMPHRNFTTADLEPYFKRADKDASGTLSRTEFLALYLAVVGDRIKKNPLLLAEALLGFIDKDKNGVLEGNELKQLLLILGFAPALLMPIPGFMKINYRAILRRMGRVLEGNGAGGKS